MSVVEEIQQAIHKLEVLRKDAAPGKWKHWPEAGDVEIYSDYRRPGNPSSEFVVAAQVRPRLDYGGKIYVDNYEPTAELIVTLHRTIDAQLAILHSALAFIDDVEHGEEATYSDGRRMSGVRMLKINQWGRAAIDLARAINEAS